METRRDFLKKMAATAMALGLDPFSGITVADDTYTNARLRLTFRKPHGWEYSSLADFTSLREKTVFDNFEEGEPNPILEADLPLVLAEDPTHRNGYFSPSLGVYDEPKPDGPPKNELQSHRRFLLDGLSYYHQNVRILKRPEWINLKGARGTISTASYTHTTTDGFTYDLLLRTIVVFREGRVHTFYFTDNLAAPHISDDTWNKTIASIAYEVA